MIGNEKGFFGFTGYFNTRAGAVRRLQRFKRRRFNTDMSASTSKLPALNLSLADNHNRKERELLKIHFIDVGRGRDFINFPTNARF